MDRDEHVDEYLASDAALLAALDFELQSDVRARAASPVAPPVQPEVPTRPRKIVKKPSPQKRQQEYVWNSATGEFELEVPPPLPVVLPQPQIRGYGD